MRFLTKETFKAPPTAEVQALMPAEIAKVKELTEHGADSRRIHGG